MISEPLILAVCSDISGQFRGKAFPLSEKSNRFRRGVGWVPTNSLITCFNTIAEGPFGSVGDLLLTPDPDAEVCVDFEDGSANEHFVIGSITEMDGSPWMSCPRNLLIESLDELAQISGLNVNVAFEQEFIFTEELSEQWIGFGAQTFRQKARFGETLIAALGKAGIEADSFLAEYGSNQYEVTVSPKLGLRAADECLITRELVRATAHRLGSTVCFSPCVNEGVASGLHIHISLVDAEGRPATYDADRPLGLSEKAAQFFAGIRQYMPAIIAFTAPSVISYSRLQPHHWSAAYNNIAHNDREAALRICPVASGEGRDMSRQYNVEYRAADATGSPHLQLAAIIQAGVQGIRDRLPPPIATEGDLSQLDDKELAELGVERLPTDLTSALKRLSGEALVCDWFSDDFVELYLAHKRGEISSLAEKNDAELRHCYSTVY